MSKMKEALIILSQWGKVHKTWDARAEKKATPLADSVNLSSLAVDAAAYYRKNYVEVDFLEDLHQQEAEICKAKHGFRHWTGVVTNTTLTRLKELKNQEKELQTAITSKTAKDEKAQDE